MSSLILQLIINGILSGALYAAIAVGLGLVFGIMKVINFAHGTFLMISMYLVGLSPSYSQSA